MLDGEWKETIAVAGLVAMLAVEPTTPLTSDIALLLTMTS